MYCPTCKVAMIIGKAIKTNTVEGALYVAGQPKLNAETLELIEVYKCPQCGHSSEIE